MRLFKKLFSAFLLLVCMLGFGVQAQAEGQSYWYLDGTSPNSIMPMDSTWHVGLTGTRVAKIWVQDLDIAGTLVFGGVMGSSLDMDGYDITMDTDGDSAFTNDRDAGIADDEIGVTLAGALDFIFKANNLSVEAGSVISTDTINETTAAAGVTIDGLNIMNDLTTTTLLGTAGDYNRIGDAGTTGHSLASEDDLLLTGKIEVDGLAYFDDTITGATHLALGANGYVYSGSATYGTFTPYNSYQGLFVQTMDMNSTARQFIFGDYANRQKDYDHAAQTNPTVFIQSVLSPDTDNGEFLGLSYLGLVGGTMETDRATFDMTLQSVAPFATATTTNRDGADIILQTSSPTNSGTIYGVTSVGANTASNGINLTADSFFVDGKAEFDGRVYFDGNATIAASTSLDISGTNSAIAIGGGMISNRAAMTPDALAFSLGTTSRNLVFMEAGDESFDFAHAQQTNPTIWIQSASQSTTQWLSLAHDQTDGRIQTGLGNLSIGSGSDSHTLSTPNDLFVSGKLEVDDIAYFDNEVKLLSDMRLVLGGGNNTGFIYETAEVTADAMHILSDATSRNTILTDMAKLGKSFDHAASSNPTLFVHSVTDPDSANDEWISMTHDVTNGVIDVGSGGIVMSDNVIYTPSGDTSLLAATQITVTNQIMRVVGNGGAVTLTGTPTIVDATDGTCTIIQGTSDANTVTLQDESILANTGLQLSGGVSFTLGIGDIIEVCYDLGDDDWYEISRSDN